MKCLAVNTANTVLSLALCDGESVLYRFSAPETRDQGNLLLSHAGQALAAAGLHYDDLDLLAVVTGPGSFTGIRIGLATLRGLALAAEKPLLGISSFDLFEAVPADAGGDPARHIIAVESFRAELYFRVAEQAPVNLTPAAFAATLPASGGPWVVAGDAAGKLLPCLPDAVVAEGDLPDAVDAARLAMARFAASGGIMPPRPVPFYLRDADVTLGANQRRIAEE